MRSIESLKCFVSTAGGRNGNACSTECLPELYSLPSELFISMGVRPRQQQNAYQNGTLCPMNWYSLPSELLTGMGIRLRKQRNSTLLTRMGVRPRQERIYRNSEFGESAPSGSTVVSSFRSIVVLN